MTFNYNAIDKYQQNLYEYQINSINDQFNFNIQNIKKTLDDSNKLDRLIKQKQQEINKFSGASEYDGTNIKSIKSKSNIGQILAVNSLNDGEYQIIINGECLTVYNKNNITIKPCNLNPSDSQKFITSRITNPAVAKYIIGTDIINNNIVYPYNIFQSKVSSECVSLNDDGNIILNKCSPNNIKQQWAISPNENICTNI